MSDYTDDRIARIKEKLSEAAAARIETFGANTHGYALGPPLQETEVRAFEIEYGVTLPESFRAFVTRVGHGGPGRQGGAGPYYGIYPMQWWPDTAQTVGDGDAADWLRAPCPLVVGPNALPEPPSDDEAYDAWFDADIAPAYHGIVALGTRGCTFEMGLIVTGPCRGRVVYFDLDHHAGPYVVRDADFLDWYERWLDELIAGYDGSWFGYGPAGDEAALIEIIRETADLTLLQEAVVNLGKLPTLSSDVWPAILPLATHPDESVRTRVARLLPKGDERAIEVAAALISDECASVRLLAIEAAVALNPTRFAEEARAAIGEDSDPRVKWAAYHALKKTKAIDDADRIRMITDPSLGSVRSALIDHTTWSDDHEEIIAGLLDAPEVPIRRSAIKVAVRLATPRLLAIGVRRLPVEDDDHARALLTHGLARRGAVEAVPTLLRFARDDDDYRRLDAARALITLGDDRAVPVIVPMLEEHRVPRSGGRSHALTIAQIITEALQSSPSEALRALVKA